MKGIVIRNVNFWKVKIPRKNLEGKRRKLCHQYWDGETVNVSLMKLSSAVKLLFGKGQINIATSSEGG